MTPQEQLCEKMRVEQSAYCLWLTAQPPEEILHHAYEYSVREDIILATEEMNLTLAQVRALLKSPAPLADVYKDFSKLETDYMSIVAQCVEDRADDLLKKEQQQNPPKVYRQSVTYAREHGELQQYHASCHLNERCRDEIDAALAQRFDGMRLGAGAVEQVVAEYGLERTKYVLAAAIQTRDGDGRISRTNREWADSIRTIKDMDRRGFDRSCYYADLQAHPSGASDEEVLARLPADIVLATAAQCYAEVGNEEYLHQMALAVSVEVCGRLGISPPADAADRLNGLRAHIPAGEERRALEEVREMAKVFGDTVCKELDLQRPRSDLQRAEER